MIDAVGGRVAESRHYPYGAVRWTWTADGSGTLPTDYRFTGQRDVGLGLTHMGARFLDSALGWWASADTIIPEPGNPQNFSRYTYVGGNPLGFVDPTGHAKYGGDDYDPADVPWKPPASDLTVAPEPQVVPTAPPTTPKRTSTPTPSTSRSSTGSGQQMQTPGPTPTVEPCCPLPFPITESRPWYPVNGLVAQPIGPVQKYETQWQPFWSFTVSAGLESLENLRLVAVDRRFIAETQLHKQYEGYVIYHSNYQDFGQYSSWMEWVQIGDVVYYSEWFWLDTEWRIRFWVVENGEELEWYPVEGE